MKGWLVTCTVFLLLAFPAGCRPPEGTGDPGPYFDMRAYLEAETARLSSEEWSIAKEVRSPKGEDEARIEQADWSQEFAPLLAFDLAHPKLLGRYLVDTIVDAGGYQTVTYEATEEALQPRKVSVWLDGDQVIALRVFDTTANIMYRSGLHGLYDAADGRYTIISRSESRLFPNAMYRIDGQAVR